MSRISTAALARSYRTERVLATVIGLVALVAGVVALVVGQGWLGHNRSVRPVADPLALDWLARNADLARGVAIGVGVVLVVLGLWWFVRLLRVERRPDLDLDRVDGTGLTVTANAVAEAVAVDAETIRGVSRARVRAVGRPDRFALRVNLTLHEGTDLRLVWRELDTEVLRRARESFGLASLPTAVRLDVDASTSPRVR
jgi:hypothetical protein